jgi:hypothetical protein
VMSPAGGNATPRKIHNDGAERKYKNEGDKWWSQTPSFSPYHILNIQCILVQQSSITLWHNNTFTMYFFTRTHYTNGLTPRRPSMPRTLPGGEFRSKSLQVFTASLGATRKPRPASAPRAVNPR